MEEQFDAQALMERAGVIVKEIRKSEAYPAILGAVAGGIAGALIAVIIAGGRSSRRAESESLKVTARPSWTSRDLIQFATVVTALVKQAQTWYREQKR